MNPKLLLALSIAVLLLLAGAPALAQQEAEPPAEPPPEEAEPMKPVEAPPEPAPTEEPPAAGKPRPPGRLTAEYASFLAQPTGLEQSPATQSNPEDILGTQVLEPRYGTEARARYRVAYQLPGTWGGVEFTYYSHEGETTKAGRDPGNFVFGETLTHPLFAGVNNDGLADAFDSSQLARLRDWHLDFTHEAFRNERLSGRWSFGWQRVTHSRRMSASYLSLVPGLPAIVPPLSEPRPDLDPLPDVAQTESRFEGRGPHAGLDIDFPVWKDKVNVEAGVGASVLRGEIDTSYFSTTQLYVANSPALGIDNVVLGPPYDEFELILPDPGGGLPIPLINTISQRTAALGLKSSGREASSQVLEGYLGFRWNIRRWLDLFGGFRSTRYTDVGLDLRPRTTGVTFTDEGLVLYNLVDVDEVKRSATYEGFYAGLTFRVF